MDKIYQISNNLGYKIFKSRKLQKCLYVCPFFVIAAVHAGLPLAFFYSMIYSRCPEWEVFHVPTVSQVGCRDDLAGYAFRILTYISSSMVLILSIAYYSMIIHLNAQNLQNLNPLKSQPSFATKHTTLYIISGIVWSSFTLLGTWRRSTYGETVHSILSIIGIFGACINATKSVHISKLLQHPEKLQKIRVCVAGLVNLFFGLFLCYSITYDAYLAFFPVSYEDKLNNMITCTDHNNKTHIKMSYVQLNRPMDIGNGVAACLEWLFVYTICIHVYLHFHDLRYTIKQFHMNYLSETI